MAMIGPLTLGAMLAFCVVLILSRIQPPPQAPGSPEARERIEHQFRLCLAAGRKIEAIKLYRSLHGTDLKDSKAAVEALMAGGASR
jgi:ribosomal protein L7/L12